MNQELIPESGIAGRYISTSKDETGSLSGIGFQNVEHFNFAFCMMHDALAKDYELCHRCGGRPAVGRGDCLGEFAHQQKRHCKKHNQSPDEGKPLQDHIIARTKHACI